MGSYSLQMSHTYELTRARTLTSTQTLWNQRGHRSQSTHDTRADFILSTRWIFRITHGTDLIHVLISRFGYLTVR